MYLLEYVELFRNFIVRCFAIYYIPYEIFRTNRNRFKKGKSYNLLSFIKYITLFLTVGVTVFMNLCAWEIPMLVNFDYEIVSGKVTHYGHEGGGIGKGINALYQYTDLTLELKDGKEKVKWIYSPVPVKIGDVVECYKKSVYSDEMNVSQVNGKDVSAGYGKGWSYPGMSTSVPKIALSIYLVGGSIFHLIMICRKRRKYRSGRVRTQFIYGRDIEKAGYLFWIAGIIVFEVTAIIAIIGVGENYILGVCMAISSDIYALGYLMVFYGSCRGVTYEDGVFHVNYSNGWERHFSREEITGIQNIKGEIYRICFRDEKGKDNEVRVTLHHKEQELILFPEKMSSGYY